MCFEGCFPTWSRKRTKRRSEVGDRAHLARRESAADPSHLAEWIIVPLPFAPETQLRGDIGAGLAGKGRVARADALTRSAMTFGAWGKTARRISGKV